MKHQLFSAALVLGIAFAAPVFAQDTVQVSQSGGNGSVTVEQIASAGNNNVTVNQGDGSWGYYGNYSGVNVSQSNVGNSSVFVMDSGHGSQINIFQRDGANLSAEVNTYCCGGGDNNFISIDQTGFDSHARVNQSFSSFSQVNITQAGYYGGNMAEVTQNGYSNFANINQMGGNFYARIDQFGQGNNVTINQRN